MANKSLRKSQLIAFDNAAAGHDGVLSDPTGEMVIKPCTQGEIHFYESIRAHPDLLPYLPKYIGRLSLGSDINHAAGALVLPGETTPDEPAQDLTASLPVVNHAWEPSGGGKIQTELAIVLENVAAGYYKPNILDVKLGARLWADDSPPEKRAKLDKVAEETTSKPLGFRIAGMKAYQGKYVSNSKNVGVDGYKIFDKHYGRSLKADRVSHGFEEFFRIQQDVKLPSATRTVIKRFIRDLEGLVQVLGKEESRMYSASLLFVYEGDPNTLQNSFHIEKEMVGAYQARKLEGTAEGADSDDSRPNFPPIQNLKLIDFAHAQWTAGKGPDENLLHGVRSVIKVLRGFLVEKGPMQTFLQSVAAA